MSMKITEFEKSQLFDEFQFTMQHTIVKFMQSLADVGVEPAANIAIEEASKALGSAIYASVVQVPDGDVMALAQKPIDEVCTFVTETVKALAGLPSIIDVTRVDNN